MEQCFHNLGDSGWFLILNRSLKLLFNCKERYSNYLKSQKINIPKGFHETTVICVPLEQGSKSKKQSMEFREYENLS